MKIFNALFVCVILCLCYNNSIIATETNSDTRPPSGTIIYPEYGSVIRSNKLPVRINAQDNQSGIKSVSVYAHTRFGVESPIKTQTIVLDKSPYNVILDCSNLPDGSYGVTEVFAEIMDNAGNVSELSFSGFVLDRNPKIPEHIPQNSWVQMKLVKEKTSICFYGCQNFNESRTVGSENMKWDIFGRKNTGLSRTPRLIMQKGRINSKKIIY